MNRAAATLLVVALLLIAGATLTPHGELAAFEPSRVCLWCGRARLTDAIANIALFVPLGVALVLAGYRVRTACAAALSVSLGVECAQFAGLPSGRVASMADLVTNVGGAAIGAQLAWRREDVFFPDARQALWLTATATTFAALALFGTAWAISAPSLPTGTVAEAPRQSALAFTPGFGWFSGVVTRVVVNGITIPHTGTGPAIVSAPRLARVAADIEVTGRDVRRTVVPLLFVHQAGDTTPALMIAQFGDGFLLRADSRGARIGLSALEVMLPLDSPSSAERHVGARVTPRELHLVADDRQTRAQITRARTATSGWTLVQSVVSYSSTRYWGFTLLWLTLLFVPVGYWGWRSGDSRAPAIVCAGAVICLAVIAGVELFAVSFPSPREWLAIMAAGGAGMALGQLSPAFDRTRH